MLDAEINITYHEVFQKNDEELGEWIDSVRQYIVNEWDEKGIPPAIGQNRDEIIDSLISKLTSLDSILKSSSTLKSVLFSEKK